MPYSFAGAASLYHQLLRQHGPILDPDTNETIDNIPTGVSASGPSGIAVSPDGTSAYTLPTVLQPECGTVSVIDLTERRAIATIPVGGLWEWLSIPPENVCRCQRRQFPVCR